MAALLSSTRSVHAQSVQPVILDLQTAGRQSTQTLTVNNTRASAIPVELRVEGLVFDANGTRGRSEEHTSELQSLTRRSYAVFCLKQKNTPLIHLTFTDSHTTK